MSRRQPYVVIRCPDGLCTGVDVETNDGRPIRGVTRVVWACDEDDLIPRATVHIALAAAQVRAHEVQWVFSVDGLDDMPLPDADFTADQIAAIRELWEATICRLAGERRARSQDADA